MKHLRKLILVIIGASLVVPPCAIVAPAQQKQQDNTAATTEQLIDVYISVMTMAYPPVGLALGAAKGLMGMMGFFDKPDLVGEALKLLNERLTNLEKRVDGLEAQLRDVRNELFRTQNLARIRQLRNFQRDLQSLTFALRQRPTERATKLKLANDARLIADEFLTDSDLWRWNDVRRDNDQMLPADFKPLPALDYYVTTLVTWVATIEYAADGDAEFVKRTYGPALQKHINYLSERTGWNELDDDAQTLPENIKKRVTCHMDPVSERPRDGKCTFRQYCEDAMARTRTVVASGDYTVPSSAELCSLPANTGKIIKDAEGNTKRVNANIKVAPEEEETERAYGTEVMDLLAAKLTRLKDYGTVREQLIGTFDPSTQTAQFLYAMKPNGELLWYRHRVVTRKTGVLSSGPQGPSPTEPARRHDTRVGNLDPRITLPAESGTFAKFEVTHFLDGPKRVGSGWENFREVMPAGLSGVYALKPDGKLMWYQHIGYETGERSWKEAREVGSGWGDFKQIVPMGDGIVYALTQDGKLFWYRHIDFANGVKAWEGPKDVGAGWGDFKQIFAGGEGVIYAVTTDGVLKWYRNKSYMTGVRDWEGP